MELNQSEKQNCFPRRFHEMHAAQSYVPSLCQLQVLESETSFVGHLKSP